MALWILPACFCLLGCRASARSPVIACRSDGQTVNTAFTFEQFRKTVAREHGNAVADGLKSIRSPAVSVAFAPLDDGRLLVVDVILVRTGERMDPARLFGVAPGRGASGGQP